MTAEYTTKQVRHLFFEREGQRCFYCRRVLSFQLRGSLLDGGWSIHHRKGRGAGMNTYSNGIVLCGTGGPAKSGPVKNCHDEVTRNPSWAYEMGLAILRNATTAEYQPQNVRVRDRAGRWFLLTEHGRAVEVEGPNR
ncbi:hypothetical protein [Microbacterium sp. PAMC21962]|uniref:hypothetical protein n=1 Tax=Microbacterium sp. PAMC21962 TaxID=2861280 RepID=UPI001C6378F2|nr:hypothetical protein [Microbacterium sp. PAMC21962]QYF98483.1 hypothetical protein KY498_04350 [Microbacterium sp. PAMC21962]